MKGRGGAVIRALGALVMASALAVGVPLLLVLTVGNPFPSSMPSVDEIRILLTQNGQGFSSFLIGTLAVLIWFIWIQLVIALGVEVVATLRRSETRRLPTIPGIQALAARLVASMALAGTLTTAPILAPALGALSFDPIEPVVATELVVQPDLIDMGASTLMHPDHSMRSKHQTTDIASDEASQVLTTLLVSEPTELWDLAEAAYGDGIEWSVIAKVNAGARDAMGELITIDTEVVPPGTVLQLPGASVLPTVSAFGEILQTGSETSSPVAPDEPARRSDEPRPTEPAVLASTAQHDVATPSEDVSSAESAEVSSAAHDDVAALDGLHVVEQGESMWSLAEEEVEHRVGHAPSEQEIAPYWVEVVEANVHRVASGDVDLIFPGEELVMPRPLAADDTPSPASLPAEVDDAQEAADPVEAFAGTSDTVTQEAADPVEAFIGTSDTVTQEAADPVEAFIGTSEAVAQEAAGLQTATPGDTQSIPEPALGDSAQPDLEHGVPIRALATATFGSALLAAGIVGAVRRRRELQRRQRPAGAMPRPPSTEAAALETALIHAAHEIRESKHGSGWRLLPAEAVASVRASGPMEVHAQPTGRLLAVPVLEHPDPAHERPRIDLSQDLSGADVATMLHRDADDLVPEVAESGLSVVPTTLVIGTDATTGDAVLIDLESAGLVELSGASGDVRRFARSAVLDLAVSERADDLCVIAIDVAHELVDLERVSVSSSWSDAHAQAVRCGHAGPHSATPLIVVSALGPPPQDQSVPSLRDLGAIIVAPALDAPVRLTIDGDRARLRPAGTSIILAALSDDDYASVAELVDATRPDAVQPVDAPFVVSEALQVAASHVCDVEPGPVEVRVLGPVEIAGASPFSSIKAVDVVCYLAFHRNGVDADQIKSWVWPAFEPPTDKAFANVLSRARTGLGTTDDGEPFLSRAGADKTYRLSADVTTDFDRFRALVALADGEDEDLGALDHLKQSLELIRGVPFSGGTASSFAWADNHVRAHVEFTIDEAVHRCADLALELDDLGTARWAALKGLELVPGCEQCFKRRFLVAGAGNNRSELRRAMADLERTAAAELGEPEAVDSISGDLLDLYHELDQALVAGSV